MTTFLKLQLAMRDASDTPAFVLINVDHVLRIYPTWPTGTANIIMNEEGPGIHVQASFDDITERLIATGGRIAVRCV